jgi:hypothetical protein
VRLYVVARRRIAWLAADAPNQCVAPHQCGTSSAQPRSRSRARVQFTVHRVQSELGCPRFSWSNIPLRAVPVRVGIPVYNRILSCTVSDGQLWIMKRIIVGPLQDRFYDYSNYRPSDPSKSVASSAHQPGLIVHRQGSVRRTHHAIPTGSPVIQ